MQNRFSLCLTLRIFLLQTVFGIILLAIFFPKQALAEASDGWLEGRLAAMTIPEKVGQLLMIDVKGQNFTPETAAFLDDGHFGNIILFEANMDNTDQTKLLVHQLKQHAVIRTGVPLLVAVDQEGGQVNRIGTLTQYDIMRHGARTIGDVYSYAPKKVAPLFRKVTSNIARLIRELGINMNLAPVLDLSDDPHSYIFRRSYSNDPQLVATLSREFVRIMDENGIVATGKHFPNLGYTRQDSHKELPVLNKSVANMLSHELVPYQKLNQVLPAVMVGHVLVPDLDPIHPASLSRPSIRFLRDRLGFQGVVLTDDLKMKAVSERYSLAEMLLKAVHADVDILVLAWDKVRQIEAARILQKAAFEGRLSQERLDRSLRRILVLKRRYQAS